MIAYTVTCEFDDRNVANEWISWLRDEHLAEVLACGALDAQVIRFDRDAAPAPGSGAGAKCEVRYHFQSREAFAAYERDHAPQLRATGLERFPASRGIRYQRSLGDVFVSMP